MRDETTDRRVQRTRQLLRSALVQLIMERGYDALSIQDITDKANLGRTTFYLHYQSKDDLLLDHHADLRNHFKLTTMNREELFGETPQPAVVTLLELMAENCYMYTAIRSAKDAHVLLRGIRSQIKVALCESLTSIFPNSTPNMPLDVLTEYIVGAQLSLIDWWMTTRTLYDAVQIATMLHQLQRAAVCDAYGITP
jgi:AcrR family transcriptional regulator